jgi:hypothetical protein
MKEDNYWLLPKYNQWLYSARMSEIQKAVDLIGGFNAAARICNVSPQAVMKWVKKGKLPRTEATGETDYASSLASAHDSISKEALLADVRQGGAAA